VTGRVVVATRGSVLADPRDVARLELVKWCAFSAMLLDHVDLWLFGRQLGLNVVGAFAFPAFGICFGLGLARAGDPLRVAQRLVAPAVVAQVAWMVQYPEHPANVLLVFGLCALAALDWQPRWVRWSSWGVVIVVAALVGEGGAFGPLFVLAGFAAGRQRWWPPLVAVAGLWMALQASIGAALAFGVIATIPARLGAIRRVRGLLSWGYALHLVALAALALILRS